MRVAGLIAVTLLSLPELSFAESDRIGRYSLVGEKTVELPSSSDPMAVPVQVEMPPAIQTAQQALEHVLAPSGYRLASRSASCPSFPTLLAWPLPEMHRHLVASRLDQALEILAGSAHYLVLDPVHRLVSFELREGYAGFATVTHSVAGRSTAASDEPPPLKVSAPEPVVPEPATVRVIGPIGRATELRHLSDEFAHNDNATPEQWMVALFQANPDGFCYHNINCLRMGSTLTVPSPATVTRHSLQAAKRILHAHYAAWRRRVHKAHRSGTPEEVRS